MELSVVEQRYRAVLEAAAGVPVSEVAAHFGVSRQSVHAWIRRYRSGGLGGLMDRSRRPASCPHQVSAEIEVVVCELRREHPRWGPLMLVHALAQSGVSPVPSRMSVYRVLVRHGLIEPHARKRPRESYLRWEREAPMALWQLDIVGGVFLADGTEAKIVTGVDDHSRYCVICQVVPRATGRAVCLAFAAALRRFGVPDEVLSDNGKQFTARFGHGGEVLFDRICRDNGITHRLTQPRSPTTTGKIERFHGSLRRELLNDAVPFTGLAAAQAAVDAWVEHYNTTRPHQALGMSSPAERFTSRNGADAEDLLPLRLPAALTVAAAPAPPAPAAPETSPPSAALVVPPEHWAAEAVAFDRVVPPSGNMWVAGRQFWLGTSRAGMVITFWADTQVIHLSAAGTRIKSLRSHLSAADLAKLMATGAHPAGPPPLPPARPSPAVEVDRTVNRNGMVGLGGRTVLAAEILAGRRVGIRVEHNTLVFFDPGTRQLLRTRPSPFTPEQAQTLQGARPAGPPPQPSTAPVTVQRHASATGVIVVAGQKIALGRIHAGQTVTVCVTTTDITIELADGAIQTVTRTTSKPVRSFKGQQHRKAAHVS